MENDKQLQKLLNEDKLSHKEITGNIMAEMLCAKFYHDMSGPITAVDNSIEFLSDPNPQMRERATNLMKSSSAQSIARLVFFRKAFGVIKAQGDANLLEIKKMIINLLAESKISIKWFDEHINISGISISNEVAKILMNLISITSSSLIFGGAISVDAVKENNATKIIIETSSDHQININEDIRKIINNDLDEVAINTKNIQALYMTRICQSAGASIKINDIDKNHINYEIHF